MLTDSENVAGIVINTADVRDEKDGEITPVNLNSGELLDLQITEFDWDREEDRDTESLLSASAKVKKENTM